MLDNKLGKTPDKRAFLKIKIGDQGPYFVNRNYSENLRND